MCCLCYLHVDGLVVKFSFAAPAGNGVESCEALGCGEVDLKAKISSDPWDLSPPAPRKLAH